MAKPEIRDGMKQGDGDRPVTDVHKEHVKKAKADDGPAGKPTTKPAEGDDK